MAGNKTQRRESIEAQISARLESQIVPNFRKGYTRLASNYNPGKPTRGVASSERKLTAIKPVYNKFELSTFRKTKEESFTPRNATSPRKRSLCIKKPRTASIMSFDSIERSQQDGSLKPPGDVSPKGGFGSTVSLQKFATLVIPKTVVLSTVHSKNNITNQSSKF